MPIDRLRAAITDLELVVTRLPFTAGLTQAVRCFDPRHPREVPAIAASFSEAARTWLTWRELGDGTTADVAGPDGPMHLELLSFEEAAEQAPAVRARFRDPSLVPITRTLDDDQHCCDGSGGLWLATAAGGLRRVADDLAWLVEGITAELRACATSPWRRWRVGPPDAAAWERLAPVVFDRPPDPTPAGVVPGTGGEAADHRLLAAMRAAPAELDAAVLDAAPEGTHLFLSTRPRKVRTRSGYIKSAVGWLHGFPSHAGDAGLRTSFGHGHVRVVDAATAAAELGRAIDRATATDAWWALARTRVALWQQPPLAALLARVAAGSPDPRLRPPATEAALAAVDAALGAALGVALPAEVRAMYAFADGQDPGQGGAIGDRRWLPLAEAHARWAAQPRRYSDAPPGTWDDGLVPLLETPTGGDVAVDTTGFHGPIGCLVARELDGRGGRHAVFESVTAWLERVVDGIDPMFYGWIGQTYYGRDSHPLDPREWSIEDDDD